MWWCWFLFSVCCGLVVCCGWFILRVWLVFVGFWVGLCVVLGLWLFDFEYTSLWLVTWVGFVWLYASLLLILLLCGLLFVMLVVRCCSLIGELFGLAVVFLYLLFVTLCFGCCFVCVRCWLVCILFVCFGLFGCVNSVVDLVCFLCYLVWLWLTSCFAFKVFGCIVAYFGWICIFAGLRFIVC